MLYKAKVAVCSEIRTKHSKQSEHHVEFFNIHLVVRKGTVRLYKVKYVRYSESMYRLRISLAHPRDCHFAHVQ